MPQLIENKRKHLQKQFSASQHDMILLSEPREDLNTREEMVRLMKESSQSFWNAIEVVWDSVKEISSSISKSVDYLAQTSFFSSSFSFMWWDNARVLKTIFNLKIITYVLPARHFLDKRLFLISFYWKHL